MSYKYFGDAVKTIRTNAELKTMIEEAKYNIATTIEINFKSYNPFSARETSRWGTFDDYVDNKPNIQKVISAIRNSKYAYTDIFKNATYLDDLKVDHTRGSITQHDLTRYFNTLFEFLDQFEYCEDAEKYNISKNIDFYNIDIPEIKDKKIQYLCELMYVDKQRLDYLIDRDPIYQYSLLNLKIDHEYLLYYLLIDRDKKNVSYSSFYNSYVVETIGYKLTKEYEILKLSDKELSMNLYFDNKLKKYMHKPDYERVIAKYVGDFNELYGKDLYEEIEKNPIITKYMMTAL